MTDDRRTGNERRRTQPWFRLDAAFLADDKIIDLGVEHGPAGPLVFTALLGAAKLQDQGGGLRMGWTQLVRGCFLDSLEQARAIVTMLAELELIEITDDQMRAFSCLITGWRSRQIDPVDIEGAERARNWRNRNRGDDTQKGGTDFEDAEQRSRAFADTPNGDEQKRTPYIDKDSDKDSVATPDGVAARAGARRSKIDQQELPNEFPPELEPVVQPVLDILLEVHALRGGNAPTRRGVGLVLADYPRRDHLDCARKLRHWATAGRGLRAKRKDWTATYRTFVDGSDDTPAPGAALSPADLGDKLLAEALGRRVA